MSDLTAKNIGLVIGGGIAAYKSLELIRRLKDIGADIHPILTPAAKHFITPLSASALSHNPCYSEIFTEQSQDISHIELANKLDLIIIAPASANRLSSIACGLAQDFANLLILAASCPILFAPAMNPIMYKKPAIQRAITQLKKDGAYFIGPNYGEMAEKNHKGLGRMSEPLEIIAKCREIFQEQSYYQEKKLLNKNFIITLGRTIEPIDPVRYLSNYSSGKQGAAIGNELAKQGANVTIIAGQSDNIKLHPAIKKIPVMQAREMLEESLKQLPCDGIICAAAVSDWRAENIAPQKLKKQAQQDYLELKFIRNPDILELIAKAEKRPKLVIGFAAETENHQENAQKKLRDKGADIILLNNVGRNNQQHCAFDSNYNQITLFNRSGEIMQWQNMSKQQIAIKLVQYIITHYF